MENRINYLCNGEKENCNKGICYKTVGNCKTACKYTRDVRYAKNFSKRHPGIENAAYWEKETAPNDRTQPEN